MNGHVISRSSIELSYKHAHQVEEQGRRLERVGASLSSDEGFTQQEREFVQDTARQIQKIAKVMLECTKVAESDEARSTIAFSVAAKQHAEAIRLHVEINRILLKKHYPNQPQR